LWDRFWKNAPDAEREPGNLTEKGGLNLDVPGALCYNPS